jgi:aryl-alcohol dehydrogenase-like predicted oxidoreductase
MKTLTLKNITEPVPRLGLGCMGMSEFYGPTATKKDAFNIMNEAYSHGIRMFDTADFYGDGDNETLIGEFIKTTKQRPFIATKCGIVRGKEILDDGNFIREYNGKPSYINKACDASLKRLGVDCIDLFYLHRIDPSVPIEDSIDALAKLVRSGKIRAIGLSEANADQIKRAQSVHDITALQSEYSLWSRHVEQELIPLCNQLDIQFVPYSPLGRGMVPAKRGETLLFSEGDFRATLERATKENLSRNQHLFNYLFDTADQLGITHFQLMLAWLFAQSSQVLPIPGVRKMENLNANVEAEAVELPSQVISEMTQLFTTSNISGGRYTVNKSVAANAAAMSEH